MVGKLPHEVMLTISSFLALEDKVILMTTCRQLYDLISSTNLYSELDLFSRNERTTDTITKFKENPSFGAQVRLLSMDLKYISDELLRQLPSIFPHITRFTTGRTINGYTEHRYSYSKDPILQWSNTLKMYDMWYDYLGILPALKTVTFPHLTDLTLGENFEPENISEGFDFYCFLPAIKNAPSLKWLTLRKCAINLELLEEIHVNCPHLKSLILFGTPIVIEQNRLFQPIIPANSLLYLEIRDPVYFDVKALFLDYISSKYRCLKKLVLDLNTMQYDSFKFAQYYTMPAIDVSDSESGSENESERVQDQIQNDFMCMYYSFESKSLQTINAYQQSATRFFSNITTEIKSLKIERNVFDNTMEALANSDTKLTNLIYKGTLKDLKQMQYISQIKSLKEMRVVIFPSTKLNLQVLPYNSITKLDVCNSGEAVYFDWLLLSFPCLQVLDINEGDGWTLSDDDNGRSVSMLSNLWSLHVNVNSLDQKCIDFLVLKAPNIKKLSIISETCVAGMRNVNIDISQWELKELALEFRDLNHNDNYYYNIKTPYVDKIVRRSRVYDSMALLGGGGHSYGEKKPPMITIISENDKQFVFYNYKLSIMQSDLSITLYAK